jgi:hypothetical protein
VTGIYGGFVAIYDRLLPHSCRFGSKTLGQESGKLHLLINDVFCRKGIAQTGRSLQINSINIAVF